MDRNQRNLEIVRQTAEILASGLTLSETFERFCLMLAQFIDASVVFIAVDSKQGAHIEFAYDHGLSLRDAHVPLVPESQTRRVLDTGERIVLRAIEELAGPLVPLSFIDKRIVEDSASAVFLPLRFGNETIGVLSVQTPKADAYSHEDVALLESCALYVAVAVRADAMRSQMELLESSFGRDALTGVATRRVFDRQLREDWARARRDGAEISLLMLDVDWFKRFNDTYGHVAGDACLNQIAQAAKATLERDSDLFARFGGEEFAALLWATGAVGAKIAADRIREAVRAIEIPHAESPFGRVTVSIGVATMSSAGAGTDALLRGADRALYAAKTAGRDRVLADALDDPGRPRARHAVPNNLHPPQGSLFGRVAEVVQASEALQHSRIVSITGVAGLGKTRVAVAAAQRRLYAYPDGAWIVDVRALPREGMLESAVLATLGLAERPGLSRAASILCALDGKELLLIFDGCDARAEEVARLCEALAASAPAVAILATARMPLGARDERAIALRPLEPADAVALFFDRAQGVAQRDGIVEADRAAIASICERVSRIPLAIELAAARVRTLSPTRVLTALRGRGAARVVESTIAWSYDLLEPRARGLLAGLTVFPAHFDLDAARDVCADEAVDPWDVAAVLREIADAGLVVAIETRAGRRFALLDAARDYCDRLPETRRRLPGLELRHARYYRALAQRRAAAESTIDEGNIDALSAEWENVRIALFRSLASGGDPVTGASLAVALYPYWAATGRLWEGRQWIEMALDYEGCEPALRAQLLYAAARIAHDAGEPARVIQIGAELVAYYEAAGDSAALAKALNAVANARLLGGEVEEAERLYTRALACNRTTGDRYASAALLNNLGSLAAEAFDDVKRAKEYFRESLELLGDFGVTVDVGIALGNLSEMELRDAEYGAALDHAYESCDVFRRLGNAMLEAGQRVRVARAQLECGRTGEAIVALLAAMELHRFQPSIRVADQLLETAFALACDLGDDALAARFIGCLERCRKENDVPVTRGGHEPFERRRGALRERLGARFNAAVRKGAFDDPHALLATFAPPPIRAAR